MSKKTEKPLPVPREDPRARAQREAGEEARRAYVASLSPRDRERLAPGECPGILASRPADHE